MLSDGSEATWAAGEERASTCLLWEGFLLIITKQKGVQELLGTQQWALPAEEPSHCSRNSQASKQDCRS